MEVGEIASQAVHHPDLLWKPLLMVIKNTLPFCAVLLGTVADFWKEYIRKRNDMLAQNQLLAVSMSFLDAASSPSLSQRVQLCVQLDGY